MKITTLGIDIAKSVFHLIGIDEKGHEVMKKKVSRSQLAKIIQNIPPCRIADVVHKVIPIFSKYSRGSLTRHLSASFCGCGR